MFKRKKKPEDSGLTPDFDSMIKILFWNSIGFFFFNFLIPYFVGSILKTSMLELGITFSMMIIGGLISNPIVGYLTDRISKKKLILVGSFGRGISYIILYVSCVFLFLEGFYFGMIVLGLSVGFFWTPFDALVSEKSRAENRSYAFGKRRSEMGKGNLLGTIISFTIFLVVEINIPDIYSLKFSPLLIFASSNFFAGIFFYKNVDENLKYDDYINEKGSKIKYEEIIMVNSRSEVIQSKTTTKISPISIGLVIGFFFLILARFASMINGSLADPFMQNYLRETILEDSPFTDIVNIGTLVMLIYMPSGMISQIIAPKIGILSDKINNSLGILITCITGSLFTFFLINANNPILFSIILTIDSSFAIGGQLILMNIFSRISKTNRGKVFGFTSWIGRIGGIFGPIFGGLAYDNFGAKAPFLISIFVELSLIPLYLIAIWKLTPHMAEKVEKENT
ncbi:MAG: MFS transporter [Promethearchaeota archaeon]